MGKLNAYEILKNIQIDIKYECLGDVSFDTLALCGMKLEQRTCTFVDNVKFMSAIATNVGVIFTTLSLAEQLPKDKYGLVITENPRLLFFKFHNLLADNKKYVRENCKTKISNSAKISSLAYIAQENVVIEDDVVIEPFVTVYPNVHVGKNSIIRSGSRIGGEGFEFKHAGNSIIGVKHLGGVEIGHNVEIQNNSCIDKAVYPWDNTMIGDNVKIDNLVHIGHGVKVGKNTMIVANSGIGGRVEIDENVWIGFGATIRNGIVIESDSRVNMGAVVTKEVKKGEAVSGNFAIEHEAFIHHMKKLSEKK